MRGIDEKTIDEMDLGYFSCKPLSSLIDSEKHGDRPMPSKSQAQNRLMHAAAEGKVKDVPPSVGKEFVKADEGRKIGKLPEHKAEKRPGAYPPKSNARHSGGYK